MSVSSNSGSFKRLGNAFYFTRIFGPLVFAHTQNEHIPSRELTYPPKMANFESMIFLFPFGGICIHSLEGIDTGYAKCFTLERRAELSARHAELSVEMAKKKCGLWLSGKLVGWMNLGN